MDCFELCPPSTYIIDCMGCLLAQITEGCVFIYITDHIGVFPLQRLLSMIYILFIIVYVVMVTNSTTFVVCVTDIMDSCLCCLALLFMRW